MPDGSGGAIMAIDSRRKNIVWRILDEQGKFYPSSYGGAQLAVLMDIRDELQRLNALLHCHNFQQLPHVLKRIDKRLAKTRKLTPGRTKP